MQPPYEHLIPDCILDAVESAGDRETMTRQLGAVIESCREFNDFVPREVTLLLRECRIGKLRAVEPVFSDSWQSGRPYFSERGFRAPCSGCVVALTDNNAMLKTGCNVFSSRDDAAYVQD